MSSIRVTVSRRLILTLSTLLFLSHAVIAAAQGHVVVANRASGNVSVIDVSTDTAVTVALPGAAVREPMYVVDSPAGNSVFIGDRANNEIVVLSARDFSVKGTVAAGNGVFHMWASPAAHQLWVVNDVDKTITVVDTSALEVVTTIPLPADLVAMGGKPHDVILDPTAPTAFVTMLGFPGDADYVVKYSTESFAELGRVAVGKDPHLSVARQNDRLYVPCQNTSNVFVLDRDTLEVLDVLAIPGAHGAGMARNGRFFYTTNLPGAGIDGVFTVDTQDHVVVGTPTSTPFAVPHNLALTPNGKKLYVTHSGGTSSVVTVYSMTRRDPVPAYLATVTVGDNPFGLAYVR